MFPLHRLRLLGRARLWTAAAALALIVAAVVAAVMLSSGGSPGAASPGGPHAVESLFQDDQLLLYSPTPTVVRTLRTLRALGVDRLRVTVLWAGVAPDPGSPTPPRGFDAADPSAYPASGWAPYDRLDVLAAQQRIALAFNVTAPGPLWAMQRGPSAVANHFEPSPAAFGAFVAAAGRRYDGRFSVPFADSRIHLPRVSFWTVWNEPNQPGWLAPQWRSTPAGPVPVAAARYRAVLDAAWSGLERTGHTPASDTILIGELAPEGIEKHRPESAISPVPFLDALYCVGPSFAPLRGAGAARLGCPVSGGASAFVHAHPALFDATGFAHHPYAFFLAPSATYSDPYFIPLSSLAKLEHILDASFAAYGVDRRLPIYLTEYGYETDPPNPFRGVSPARQAAYIDQAQYMAWLDPRVRMMSQFLLVDSAPDNAFKPGTLGYWSTFQTGLEYLNGVHKPSYVAYRLPIFIARPSFSAGGSVTVWAMLRPAPNGTRQRAQLQWRARSAAAYRTLATVTTDDPTGALSAAISPPGSGLVRVVWTSPAGQAIASRAVAVNEQ